MEVPSTRHEDASTRWGPASSRSWRPADDGSARSVFRHRPPFARSASASLAVALAEAEIGGGRRECLRRTHGTTIQDVQRQEVGGLRIEFRCVPPTTYQPPPTYRVSVCAFSIFQSSPWSFSSKFHCRGSVRSWRLPTLPT